MKAGLVCMATIATMMLTMTVHGESFVLKGNQRLDIMTQYDYGWLYDTSTTDVKPDGQVRSLTAYHNSHTILSGGKVGLFEVHDYSTVDITAGNTDIIIARENSRVSLVDGCISNLHSMGNSVLNLSGGNIGLLYIENENEVTVSGGYITHFFNAGYETVTIEGGKIENLGIYGPSTVLYGYDFELGEGLSWGTDGSTILGTGIIRGKWFGQTEPWSINLFERSEETAIYAIVPEPVTVLLFGLGGLIFRRYR